MAVRHLTDEQIQRYLDGDLSHDSDVAHHLHQCAVCRRKLQLYRQVYAGLEQDVGFQLTPGFAESVMARLVATPEKNSPISLAGLILIICGSVIMTGLALYFLGVRTLTEKLASLSAVAVGFGSSIVESLKAATASLGVTMDVALFTGLILLTFAAIDRILFRYRGGHFCL